MAENNMEKTEYSFPDEAGTSFNVTDDELSTEVGDTGEEVQVEIIDDTPPQDRGRKPSEPPSEITEDELENYSDKVRKRLEHFSKGYHDERRAKEAAERQRQELERITHHLAEENKRLKRERDFEENKGLKRKREFRDHRRLQHERDFEENKSFKRERDF